MENRYEIHYDEIIPGTSCTYRSNGCTIIPLRIIRIHVYTTYDRQPYATLARHGGHMLRRASNTTTSDAIDTYSSKSPLHARERLQRLSVSPSPKRFLLHQFLLGVANSFSSLLNPFSLPASPPPFVPVYSIFHSSSAVSIFSTLSWQRIRPSNWNNWNCSALTSGLENRVNRK